MSAVQEAVHAVLSEPLKIDIGCGKNKQAGFIGIDQYAMEGVDLVIDLRKQRWLADDASQTLRARMEGINAAVGVERVMWRFADNSVDQAHCSHFLEHLTNFGDAWERVNFFNELHRILKVGAQCSLIFPHWCSNRYYGDPTHKEPFSEMGFYYLNREWRKVQAPHADVQWNPNGYACDFDATWAYSMHADLHTRPQPYQQAALTFWKEAATDIMATITKRAPPASV